MKQKLSNYIAEKLLASGITDVFMITGGGAMHLDDALGHQEDFTASTIIMSRHVRWQRRRMPASTTRLRQCA